MRLARDLLADAAQQQLGCATVHTAIVFGKAGHLGQHRGFGALLQNHQRVAEIDAAIGRHPVHRKKMAAGLPRGRAARTSWDREEALDGASLLPLLAGEASPAMVEREVWYFQIGILRGVRSGERSEPLSG